jgi:CTP synthase
MEHGLDAIIVRKLGLPAGRLEMSDWKDLIWNLRNPRHEVSIAVVGKYAEHKDAYKSIYEAIDHAGMHHHAQIRVGRIHSEEVEREGAGPLLAGYDGILVPGGFGERGIEGKIEAIQFARTKNIPFFGICLGMQCAAIEFGRNVVGLEGAHSTEFNKDTRHPVICLLDEQKNITYKGGTMRLGAQTARLAADSRAREAYGSETVQERHRHRYEFNNVYRQQFAANGMQVAGTNLDGSLVEILEIPDHPWFVSVQFHPEFQSKPTKAHSLFAGFVGAAIERKTQRGERMAEVS